jgi:phage gp45-like
MEDLPGTYIEIDAEAYARCSMTVRVREGKIVEISCGPIHKLVPGATGVGCNIQDVAVVSNSDKNVKWTKRTYEED